MDSKSTLNGECCIDNAPIGKAIAMPRFNEAVSFNALNDMASSKRGLLPLLLSITIKPVTGKQPT